jgi:hypothetical protein
VIVSFCQSWRNRASKIQCVAFLGFGGWTSIMPRPKKSTPLSDDNSAIQGISDLEIVDFEMFKLQKLILIEVAFEVKNL